MVLLAATLVCTADSTAPARHPPPDRLRTVWTATVSNLDGSGGDPTDHTRFIDRPQAAFSSQAAVLPDLTSIQIRDPETGRMLHDINLGQRVGDVALARGVTVAQTGPPSGQDDYGALRGYDTSSGRALWTQAVATNHVVWTRRYELGSGTAAVTSRGIVVVTRDGYLSGLDLRTGQRSWRLRSPCAAIVVSATAATVVVLCGHGQLVLVDPGSGRLRKVTVPRSANDLSTTPDAVGVIALRDRDRLTVIADSGKVLGRITRASSLALVSGDQAVVADADEISALSLTHGTIRWQRRFEAEVLDQGVATGSDISVSSSDGQVMVNRLEELGRPGATSFTDLSGTTTPPLPWPVSGEFAGAVPGLIFIASHSADQYAFTALRPVHQGLAAPRLGGADPADWPDPCGLLTHEQLATLGRGSAGFPARPSPTAARLGLNRTDRCEFTGRHPFSLQVGWVAPDDDAAAFLAQSLLPAPYETRQAGPGGYRYFSYPATAPAVADRALVLRGKLIINVFASGQAPLAAKVARLLQPRHPAGAALERAAIEQAVAAHGFTAVIPPWPPTGGRLRAVYANCGFECRQVFLFHNGRLVGAPPGESTKRNTYQDVQILSQDGTTVRLAALAYFRTGARTSLRYVLIALRLAAGRLMYQATHTAPWRPAPPAPHRR
jgi:outer membrane protein assembly factor BamB